MPTAPPTLHLLAGKPAAGKSTLAAKLSTVPLTVILSEDELLAALFGDQMTDLRDYVRCSRKLRAAIEPHVASLLNAGLSVVLDFPMNTPEARAWARGLIDATGVPHVLHWLDVPDDDCKARLQARNAGGDHPFAVTDAQFDLIAAHVTPPSPEEGFNVQVHRSTASSAALD